jgi:hypothetical protein
MDLRKIIREEFEQAFSEGPGTEEIKGYDILNHSPFAELPETRGDVDWKNRGRVFVPSLDTGDARMQVFSKDDLTGSEVQGPKMVHKFTGYIDQFKSKYGEEPIFTIDGDKVDIVNPGFQEWRERYLKGKGATLAAWGTTNEESISDKIIDKDQPTMDTPTGTLFIMNVNESKKDNK